MAGTRFSTRILVTPSIFRLMARMSREPTELIYARTSAPSIFSRISFISSLMAHSPLWSVQ